MFTLTLDCELSGKNSRRRPLSNWYSVMPSTVATFFGAGRSPAAEPPISGQTTATSKTSDVFLITWPDCPKGGEATSVSTTLFAIAKKTVLAADSRVAFIRETLVQSSTVESHLHHA